MIFIILSTYYKVLAMSIRAVCKKQNGVFVRAVVYVLHSSVKHCYKFVLKSVSCRIANTAFPVDLRFL